MGHMMYLQNFCRIQKFLATEYRQTLYDPLALPFLVEKLWVILTHRFFFRGSNEIFVCNVSTYVR